MARITLEFMKENHANIEHEEDTYLQVLVNSHDEEYFGQVLVVFQNKDEEVLAM